MHICGMRFIFISLICSLFFVPALAQTTVMGSVTNQEKVPLPYATISLTDTLTKRFLSGAIADTAGYFFLTVGEEVDQSTLSVTASMVGYLPRTVSLSTYRANGFPGIVLTSADKELALVTVKAARKTIEQRQDRLLFHVASGPLADGLDGTEVLQRAPNVWLDDDGNLLIRNEAASVFINGRPLRLSGGDLAAYLRQLRSEDILRLEIRTTAGANTDAQSGGGIVDIILKKPPRGVSLTPGLNGQYGNRGSRTAETTLNGQYGTEKWTVYGSGGYLSKLRLFRRTGSTDYFTTDLFLADNQLARDSFYRVNFRAGGVWEPNDRHSIGLEAFGNFSDFNFDQDNQITLTGQEDLIEEGRTVFSGYRDLTAASYTLNYSWTPDSSGRKWQVFGDYTQQEEEWYNGARTTYQLGVYPDNEERNQTVNTTKISGWQTDYVQPLNIASSLETGLKWTLTERANSLVSEDRLENEWAENDRSTQFDYREDIMAAYATYRRDIGKRYFLSLGWRSEWTAIEKDDRMDGSTIRQRYVNHFPAIFISRKIRNDWILSASYRKQLSRPPFSFLNDNIRKFNDFRYELGNPDLSPEFRHRAELALQKGRQQLALYYRRTNDAINGIYYLEGEVAFYQKFNSGSQRQWGLEYNRSGKLFSGCDLTAIVQLFHRQFQDPSGQNSFRQNTFKLRLIATLALGEKTKLEVFGNYYSPQADAFFVREPLIEGRLMLRRQLCKGRLNLRLQLRDVFNTLVFANERPFDTFTTTTRLKPATRSLEVRLSWVFRSTYQSKRRRARSVNEARGRL